MLLQENPFWLLGSSPRDSRKRIADLVEERSLISDDDDLVEASNTLTNPRRRLQAEIAWLPGVAPKKAAEIVQMVIDDPRETLLQGSMSGLAKANVLASALPALADELSKSEAVNWITSLGYASEDVNAESVLHEINEERTLSGFPEASEVHLIETEIDKQRQFYKGQVRAHLNSLTTSDLIEVVTEIVETVTDMGEVDAPLLIDELVDSYEVDATNFLQSEAENIYALLDRLNRAVKDGASDSQLDAIYLELETVTKNWDMVAQPIQVSTKSRGLPHEASREVAYKIRDCAIELFNEHEKLELTKRITAMLSEVFAEVVDVAARTEDDADTLDDIEQRREEFEARSQQDDEDFRREMAYSVEIGLAFKNTFSMSADGINWKGKHIALDDIDYFMWGGTSHSINGIPTGTTHRITYGGSGGSHTVETKKGRVYEEIIGRLWKAAGVRILFSMIDTLRKGGTVSFNEVVLHDNGVQLERHKLIGANEEVFCTWSEVQIYSHDGCLGLQKKGDRKVRALLPYQECRNVHVLEFMIRFKFDKPGATVSQAFMQGG